MTKPITKLLVSTLLALAMIVGLAPAASAAERPFVDVTSSTTVHWRAINTADVRFDAAPPCRYGRAGTGDRWFCPAAPASRAFVAEVLYETLDLPYYQRGLFTDLWGQPFHRRLAIESIREAGITYGCNPPAGDRYCPNATITRGELAAMLVRAFNLPRPATGPVRMVDAQPASTVFWREVQALVDAQITKGCDPPVNQRFCPRRDVSRAEVVEFAMRAVHRYPH